LGTDGAQLRPELLGVVAGQSCLLVAIDVRAPNRHRGRLTVDGPKSSSRLETVCTARPCEQAAPVTQCEVTQRNPNPSSGFHHPLPSPLWPAHMSRTATVVDVCSPLRTPTDIL